MAAAELGIILKAQDDASKVFKDVGDSAEGMGGKIKAVGLIGATAFVAAGAAALKFGSDFHSAYNTIRTGTGATGDALQGLQNDFKNVLKDVPANFGDASTAIADLNTRLGLTGQPLQDMSKQFLELSRITGTDLGTNIETVTRAFGDWSVNTDDQAESLDKLFRISQMTGPSVDELSRLIVQFGAPMRQFGFSFEESAILLGKFQKEGVNTELVMGSLRIAGGKFAKENIPLRQGLEDTIAEIQRLGPSAEATALAMEIFGARAGVDMVDTILSGKFAIDDMVGALDGMEDTIIGVGRETMGLGERFTLLKNRVLVILEPLLSGLFTGLLNAIDTIGPLVSRFFDMLGSQTNVLDNLRKAFDGLQVAGDLFRVLIAGMTGDWTTGMQLIDNIGGESLQRVANRIWDFGETARNAIGQAVAFIQERFAALAVYFESDVRPAFENIATAVLFVVGIVRDHWPQIRAIIEPIMDQVLNIIRTVTGIIGQIIALFLNLIQGEWGDAWNNIKNIVSLAANFLEETVKNLGAVLEAILRLAWDLIKAGASAAWDGLKSLISSAADAIWQSLQEKAGNIRDAILWPFEQAGDGLRRIWWGIRSLISDSVNGIIGTIQSFVNAFASGVNWVSSKLGLGDVIPLWNAPVTSNPVAALSGGGWAGAFAKGGVVPRSGIALVGEEGPELVQMPAGAHVFPSGDAPSWLKEIAGDKAIGGPFDDAFKAAKAVAGAVIPGGAFLVDGIREAVKMGAEPLLKAGLSVAGVGVPRLPGVFADMASRIWDVIYNAVLDVVRDWVKGAEAALPAATGILGNPLPPGSYAVTQEFGMSPFAWAGAYGGSAHSGIDLGAPLGTSVFAADGGDVAVAGWNGGYGNYIRLAHGAMETAYAHLNTIAVRLGQLVEKGQLIGTVDSTGYSTGHHLHFETYQNGSLVNPRSLVGFERGTDWVPRDGAYFLHRGEAVRTAEENRRGGDTPVHFENHFHISGADDPERIYRMIEKRLATQFRFAVKGVA